MSDVLKKIIETKKTEVAQLKADMSLHELHHQAAAAPAPAGFAAALKAASVSGYGLIAELKKASPSKGLIRADFDIPSLARAYADGGASCLSVLTDKHYFQGDDAFLMAARTVSSLPVLRKDFIIDPVQIVHSRALGADCILLIMAALSDAQAQELEAAAHELGMDVLIEVHDSTELDRAFQLTSPLMGINNRNLKTMEISLQVGLDMLPRLPKDRIAITESGLFTADDLALMAATGARCFLIGESLMRSDDVTSATAALLANPVPA
ncbi:MAG: indole-3-glycerol phosphate synthase TrpC [Pseudomonadota bacterium]|nr:indole-3-glycerol phosphate synthase TrpC [Pseudomonadota bacterium]